MTPRTEPVAGAVRPAGTRGAVAHETIVARGRVGVGRATPVATEVVVHLRRARDLIDARFAEPLDLDAMARAAGFSRYHFAREFRVAFGEPPGAYLSRRRVERAKRLLETANLTVTEVCMVVGFSSLSSFSRRFAELVGCGPAAYQRRMAERGGPPQIPGCFAMAWGRPTASADKPPAPHRPYRRTPTDQKGQT